MSEPDINFDSQWNMAAAYFYRCHIELAMSNYYGSMNDFNNQLQRLYNLHKELSGQMKPDELKRTEELEDQARALVGNQRTKTSVDLIRKALYDYEIYMRQIMKNRKMDLPRSKDPGKAVLGGGE